MLYSEFVNKAIDLTIEQADNGLYYLEPMWKNILHDNELSTKIITDVKCSLDSIEDILKLEIEKRNTINSNKNYVINWIYDIISTQIEPAMLAEETEYIKQVTEFMKETNANK